MMIKLETERLIIRDLKSDDLEARHAWISNPEVMYFLNWKTNSLEETKKGLEDAISEIKKNERKKYFFTIYLKENNQFIGETGITISVKNEKGGIGGLGYFLLKKIWEKGIATESSKEIIRFGFNKLELHKMTASCDKKNKASEKIMIKCGLTKEGEYKKHGFHKGKWRDRLDYGLLKDVWLKSNK